MNNRRWFHSNIQDRKTSEDVLLGQGFDGSYLVRRSQHAQGNYTLSVRCRDDVIHVPIKCEAEGYSITGGDVCSSLGELIHYYSNGYDVIRLENNQSVIALLRPVNCSDPTNERWYHGRITRDDADKVLKVDPGSFLVRESNTKPGDFVISCCMDNCEIENVLVKFEDRMYSVPGTGDSPKFQHLADLVDHYRDNPLVTRDRRVLRLDKPVNTTRLNKATLAKRVEAVKNSHDGGDNGGFLEEFEDLQNQIVHKPCTEGRKPVNISKNRYKNILPFDETRIILDDGNSNDPGSDYINANTIQMNKARVPLDQRSLYIGTQGCLTNTVNDFWRMVWQENSCVIVMLTRLQEKSKNKCHCYWPDEYEGEKLIEFHNSRLEIVHKSTRQNAKDFTVTELQLTFYSSESSRETRTVYHYHFLSWPDKSVPKNPGPILEFIREIKEVRFKMADKGPCIVHCSAGIGRTGAFIVLDSVLRLIDLDGLDCEIDIRKAVEEARLQRADMVQTPDQYRFIYEAVKYYFETQSARLVTQHVTTDDVSPNYENLYITKSGIRKSFSVPCARTQHVGERSPAKLEVEPLYANQSAANVARLATTSTSKTHLNMGPTYENASSAKRSGHK